MIGFIYFFFGLALMTTLTSVNVNGLRARRKMKELVYVYRSDILFIQETIWDEDKVKEMREEWEGDMFYNNGARNTRGVAILIKKDKVEEAREVYRDETGRIFVIEFRYREVEFRLINIYVPNIELDKRGVLQELEGLVTERCILVGDFNTKCIRLDVGKRVELRWEISRGIFLNMIRDKGHE